MSEATVKRMTISFNKETHTATVTIGAETETFCFDNQYEARTCHALVPVIGRMKVDARLATGWEPDLNKWAGAFRPFDERDEGW